MAKQIYKLEMPVALANIQYGYEAQRKTGGTPLATLQRPPAEFAHQTARTYNNPCVELPIVPNDPSMSPTQLFMAAHKKRMVLTMTVEILDDDDEDVGVYESINGDWI